MRKLVGKLDDDPATLIASEALKGVGRQHTGFKIRGGHCGMVMPR